MQDDDAEKNAPQPADGKNSAKGEDKPVLGKNKEDAKTPKVKQPEVRQDRVLVVEDARILRKMLVKILQEKNFLIDEAGNGHEALALLRRSKSINQPYDLIITDLMMPEMDGWTLIDQMVEKGYFPAIPVIVVTATASVDSVKRCARKGVRHYIVKPFETARVLETVRKALALGGEVSEGAAEKPAPEENAAEPAEATSASGGIPADDDESADHGDQQQAQQTAPESPDVASASSAQ